MNANTGTVVGANGAVLRTTNSGTNWIAQSSGVVSHLYSVSFSDVLNGTAVGVNGTIIHTTNGGVAAIQLINNKIPDKYYLYQNYPNPFNPSTNIKFDLPKKSYVRIIIYDILGKTVGTLVDEYKEVGGYQVEWDGSNYSSGTYFYKLETNNYTDVKKMILLK